MLGMVGTGYAVGAFGEVMARGGAIAAIRRGVPAPLSAAVDPGSAWSS